MNFLTRLWNIVVGRTSAALDAIENPEDQLRLTVTTLDAEMTKLRQSAAAALTEEKKLKIKIENLLMQAQDWEKKAMLTLGQGQEELAKEALIRKGDAENEATRLKSSWESQAKAVENIMESLRATQIKTENAKREFTVLLARYQTAKTQQTINKQLNGLSEKSPNNLIESISDKILKIESESQAELQMMGTRSHTDFDTNFAKLEKQTRGDEALAQLKQKMNLQMPDSNSSIEGARDVTNSKKKIGS